MATTQNQSNGRRGFSVHRLTQDGRIDGESLGCAPTEDAARDLMWRLCATRPGQSFIVVPLWAN